MSAGDHMLTLRESPSSFSELLCTLTFGALSLSQLWTQNLDGSGLDSVWKRYFCGEMLWYKLGWAGKGFIFF